METTNTDVLDPLFPFVPKALIESLLSDAKSIPLVLKPTIRKTSGAFLGVEINGLSGLETKIAIDDLQETINAVYEIVVQIITQYNGDVIKCSGDGVMAMWTTSGNITDEISLCTKSALACAVELNKRCSSLSYKFEHNVASWVVPTESTASLVQEDVGRVVVNINTRLSSGDIYVANVGCDGRWMCFILGEVVEDLSNSFGHYQGKLLLSDKAHRSLSQSSNEKISNAAVVACECKELDGDFFEFSPGSHDAELSNISHEQSSVEDIIETFFRLQTRSQKVSVKAIRLLDHIRQGILSQVHEYCRTKLNLGNGNHDADSISGDSRGSRMRSKLQYSPACIGEVTRIVTVCVKIHTNLSIETGAKYNAEDASVLAKVQRCAEIMIGAFAAKGGQVAQMVAESKGMTCLATFGLHLPGAMDDCGSAISSAHAVEVALKEIGLRCSVGVAMGDVYCGMVGTSQRHELVIMGRSMRLAALLAPSRGPALTAADIDMEVQTADDGAAFLSGIRCDQAVQQYDHSHSFVALDHVIAKGYSEPVLTFRPVRSRSYDPLAVVSSFNGFPMKPTVCGDLFNGRIGELEEAMDFFFRSTSSSASEATAVADGEKTETQWQCKILLVVGEESIGIDAYLSSVGRLMGLLAPPAFTMYFRGKCRTAKSTTRFIVWKNIFGDFLTYLGGVVTSKKSAQSTSKKPLRFTALDFLLTRLPPAIRDYAPLLTFFGLIPKSVEVPGNELVAKMANSLKLAKTIELLTATLNVATDFLRNSTSFASIMFIIDDIQFMDTSSWELVENIMRTCRGITFVASYGSQTERSSTDGRYIEDNVSDLGSSLNEMRMEDENAGDSNSMSETAGGTRQTDFSNNSMDSGAGSSVMRSVKQICAEDSSKGRCMYLGPLSRDAVTQLIVSFYMTFFKQDLSLEISEDVENAKRINETLDKLYFASGGHPLHVLEIASSVVQSGKCYSTMMFFDKLDKVLSKIKSNNIDDLIYFNFDQLSPECQLVLKAASVVAASGTNFSAAIIGHVITDMNYEFVEVAEATAPGDANPAEGDDDDEDDSDTDDDDARPGLRRDESKVSFSDLQDAAKADVEAGQEVLSPSTDDNSGFGGGNGTSEDVTLISDYEGADLDVADLTIPLGAHEEEKQAPQHPLPEGTDCDVVDPEALAAAAAAEAVANQKVAKEDMLAKNIEMVMACFKEIMAVSSFLRPFNASSDDDAEESRLVADHESLVADFDESTSFRFASSIYRGPVYNTMLLQQKRQFHARFAKYLEHQQLIVAKQKGVDAAMAAARAVERNETVKAAVDMSSEMASQWYTQGFHWHHAAGWMKASACFFQAAKVLAAEGAFNDANMYFCWSYNMLQALRQENGVVVTHRISVAASDGQCSLSTIENVAAPSTAAFQQQAPGSHDGSENQSKDDASAGDGSNSTPTGASSGNIQTGILEKAIAATLDIAGNMHLTEKQQMISEIKAAQVIYNVFKGDILSLETTIMMLIRFSQILLLTQEDQSIVSIMLKDALQLIMIARRSTMKLASKKLKINFFHTPYLDPILHGHLASADGSSTAVIEKEKKSSKLSNKKFYLRDTSVIFPILSALSMQYMSGFFRDDENYSKLAGLEQVFMTIAEDYGDPVHIIRALTVSDWRLTALRQYPAVIKVVEQIRHLYDYEKHSHRLITTYTLDGALKGLASGVQSRIFVGDFSGANENYAFIRKLIPKIKHVHSLEVSVVPLCVCLMLMEMFDEAVDLFFEYFVIESTAVGHSMFRDQNPFVAEMLLQISNLSEEQKDVLRKSVRGGSWLDEVELMSSDGKPIATRRSPSVATLEMSGFGIDCAKAKLCYLKAKQSMVTASEEAVNACLASLFFVDATVAFAAVSNELNHLNALWIKADALALLTEIYAGKDSMMEEAYAILCLDAMVESLLLSRDMQSPLLDLLAGQRADTILATMQSAYCSPGRLMRQGRVAELSAAAILAFSEEKTRPLLDFSRSIPIRSLKRDEKSVKVKINSNAQTTITFWARPWMVAK